MEDHRTLEPKGVCGHLVAGLEIQFENGKSLDSGSPSMLAN